MRDANASTNRYLSRLGLDRVPRVEEAAVRRDVKLFQLMVAVDQLDLAIDRGEFFTFLGSSGRTAAAC